MTLGEFLQYLNTNPIFVYTYAVVLPVAALMAWWMGKGEGHMPPWKYVYAVLVYLVCIPGIFAATLNVYQFLFNRTSIMDLQLNTQVLPIFSMIITLLLINRNVSFRYIPGFDRISSFLTLIAALIGIMWIIDRVRLVLFTYLPIQYLIIIFVIGLLIVRYGLKRLFR